MINVSLSAEDHLLHLFDRLRKLTFGRYPTLFDQARPSVVPAGVCFSPKQNAQVAQAHDVRRENDVVDFAGTGHQFR